MSYKNGQDGNDSKETSSEFSLISSLRYDPDLPSAARLYAHPHDSQYYLLSYHRDRLLRAVTHFKWLKAVEILQEGSLDEFSSLLDRFLPDRTKPWRLRVTINREGEISVDVHATTPEWPLRCMFLPLPSTSISTSTSSSLTRTFFDEIVGLNSSFPWRLAIDSEQTVPSSFTTYKTTVREHYDAARKRVGIVSPTDNVEVLMVNTAEEVMEGSITSVYFRRRIHRIHPPREMSKEENPDDEMDLGEWVTPPLSSGGMDSVSREYALGHGFCVEQVIRVSDLVDGDKCLIANGVRGFMPAVLDLSKAPS